MPTPDSQVERQNAVRQSIHLGATYNKSYLIMNLLAAMIASYGLFANSPAVVIGAMVVATLLEPILGVSLALVDIDIKFLRQSLITLLGGILCVFLTGCLIGIMHRDLPITDEIMSRTAPNLLDLMIALAGGAAGAYAIASFRFSTGIVGVAIATALVPPLASAGILFARGELRLALGALLLGFINMLAIQFSSSIIIWFSKLHHTIRNSKPTFLGFLKQDAMSIFILLVMGIGLSMNLRQVAIKNLYETKTKTILHKAISASRGLYLTDVRFETIPGKTIIRAVINGPTSPSAKQVTALEEQLPLPPDSTAVELRVRFIQTETINRHGLLYTDTRFGARY